MSNPAELRLAADSLLRVLGVPEASPAGPPAASLPAQPPSPPPPAPTPQAFTSLSQLLSPETIAALAQLEAHQRAAAQAAEAEAERAWDAWEANAGMARPQAVDAPAGSALAAAGTDDDLAWLRPDPADVVDLRYGWGDGPTY